NGKTSFSLGDLLGAAAANGTVYAAWTGTTATPGNQDIVLAHFAIPPSPAPATDRFEPNDVAAAATDLGTVIQRTLPRLSLPAGDGDWFKLNAANLAVTATPSAPGQLLALELRDANGVLLQTGTAQLGADGRLSQSLTFASSSSVTYLLHVSAVG